MSASARLSVRLQAIAQVLEDTLNEAAGEPCAFVLVLQADGVAQYISNSTRADGTELIESLLARWKAGRADIPAHYKPGPEVMKRPPLRPAILALLDRDGPMRAAEIAQALNRNQRTVSSMLRYIKQTQPDAVHIARYERFLVTGDKWRAVWALGPGTDARPPRP